MIRTMLLALLVVAAVAPAVASAAPPDYCDGNRLCPVATVGDDSVCVGLIIANQGAVYCEPLPNP